MSCWKFLFQQCEFCVSWSRIWWSSIRVHIPIIINAFLLYHSQIGVSGSCYINVFQWNREWFFFWHMELNSRFIVMTIDEVILNRTKVFQRLQSHLLILSVEDFPVRLEVLHWDFHSLQFVTTWEWVLGIRNLFRLILLYHLQLGIWTFLIFVTFIPQG